MNYGKFIFKEVTYKEGSNEKTVRYLYSRGTVICAYIDSQGRIMLNSQYRPIFRDEFLELPGGSRDEGESFESAARREFEEETGYRVTEIKKLASMIPSIGATNEEIHLFMVNIDEIKYNDGEDKIRIVRIPFDDAVEMVMNGEIRDGKTMTSILFINNIRLDAQKKVQNDRAS